MLKCTNMAFLKLKTGKLGSIIIINDGIMKVIVV